jgi:hydroxymethylglutaryl-CoA lyase
VLKNVFNPLAIKGIQVMPDALPSRVTLTEVGPRDGFQMETCLIPTELKVEVISALADAGIRYIQVASFVHPDKVPQMADADVLVGRLPQRGDVVYTGLTLNVRGVERAHAAGLKVIEISISVSDTHSRKNAGMSRQQALEQGLAMIRLAETYHMQVRFSLQCAFGCVYEGKPALQDIVKIICEFSRMKSIAMFCLADTTGMADPRSLGVLLKAVFPLVGSVPLALHLHDTRGMGLANVYAALTCGVRHFDTALGGMGGCPFVAGASGNIATEDTAHMLETMGIATGLDIGKVAACSQRLAHFLKKPLPGKIYRLPEIYK